MESFEPIFFENSIYKKDLIFENMKRIIDANNSLPKGRIADETLDRFEKAFGEKFVLKIEN